MLGPSAAAPSDDDDPAAPADAAPARAPAGPRRAAAAPAEPEVFVPLDLPGQGPAPSYDEPTAEAEADGRAEPARSTTWPPPSRAWPTGRRPSTVDVDDEELAKQLATLSPRAASAIRAAAEATTDEERDAALDEVDDEDQPLNRGLLLKFLSSVKS